MSNGHTSKPFFDLQHREITLASGDILRSYSAETMIALWDTIDNQFFPLPFRLDTGTEITMFPASWLKDKPDRFGATAGDVKIDSAGGRGTGTAQLVREVRSIFTTEPDPNREFRMDVLISPTLDKPFGLLSLRDVWNHYFLRSFGTLQLDSSGKPMMPGRLELTGR